MAVKPDKSDRKELLPIRHPDNDFFVCNIVNPIPKDDMGSMEHPIFSLATKPDQRILTYKHKNVTLEITPSMKGLATIHDKDILIYCMSQIIARKNMELPVGRKLYIQAYDLLVATNRPTGGESYERLVAAMERLSGTRIKTNLEAGGDTIISGFGMIESWDIVRRTKEGRMVSMTVTLSEWLYNSIMAEEVLTLSKDYFRLRKPIERRVYEIARKHCGHQKSWKVKLGLLHKKCGSADTLRKFRMKIKYLENAQHMPDYAVSYDKDKDMVTFANQNGGKALPEEKPVYLRQETIEDAKPYAITLRKDLYALEEEWKDQLGKSMPKDPDSDFLTFCQKRAIHEVKQQSLF